MKDIPDGSVDLVLCDPPYGVTACKWDVVIPLEPLWAEYERVIKDNGAILLFSQMPFGAELIQSNRKMYRYERIWDKGIASGFLNANRMPLRKHENILVFYKKLPTYNPQKTPGKPYKPRKKGNTDVYGTFQLLGTDNKTGDRFPVDIIHFTNADRTRDHYHPTQKPAPLLEYLIKTYTNPGELVLDNCMGSGSTGVACINTGRRFIGIEKDQEIFDTAANRIKEHIAENTPAADPAGGIS